MESPDSLDTQDTPITDKMTNSLDDYYCDDYDGNYDGDNHHYNNNDNDNNTEYIKPEDLITCDNCGNIWDGYAQCNCYQIRCYDSDSSVEQEQEQEQDLENPARKAAFEKQDLENSARKFIANSENINSEK